MPLQSTDSMRIEIKVFPKSSRNELVEKNGLFKAYITEAPEKGKANKAVMGLVAEKFNVSKNKVTIVRGMKNRNKIVEVDDCE